MQRTSRISRIVCVSKRRSAFLPASLTLRRGDSGADPIDPEWYADRAIAARSAPLLTGKTKHQTVGAFFSAHWALRCSMSGADTLAAHAYLSNLILLKQFLKDGQPLQAGLDKSTGQPQFPRAGLTT